MKSEEGKANRRVMPYFVEFVKFTTGFVVIVAIALIALRFITSAAQDVAF